MEIPPKEVSRKGRYFLGGELFHYEEVVELEGEKLIWASNMRCNRDPICVVVTNGFKSTQIFREQDSIVNTGTVLRRGNGPESVAYRASKIEEWDRRSAQDA